MTAWGWAFMICATAASTLSLLTGDKALPTMAGRFRSINAWLTAARPPLPIASSSANTAMRSWFSVAQWRAIL
jgi:hypothetical protein